MTISGSIKGFSLHLECLSCDLTCSGHATQPLVTSRFVHILRLGLAQAADFANTMSDEPLRSHESLPHFRRKEVQNLEAPGKDHDSPALHNQHLGSDKRL